MPDFVNRTRLKYGDMIMDIKKIIGLNPKEGDFIYPLKMHFPVG